MTHKKVRAMRMDGKSIEFESLSRRSMLESLGHGFGGLALGAMLQAEAGLGGETSLNKVV
jgi:hypothetical protein